MIDTLAKTYGKLPSEVLLKGDTFDMLVFDVSSSYAKHEQQKANKQAPSMSDFDPVAMQEITKKILWQR